MAQCSVCGEEFGSEAKACPVCGTSVPKDLSSGPGLEIADSESLGGVTPSPPIGPDVTTADEALQISESGGIRECPDCHATYDANYADQFCNCGAELQSGPQSPVTEHAGYEAPPAHPQSLTPLPPARPPAGTVCLTLFSKDREIIAYYPLDKDVVLIGRRDPVRGDFPDLDLGDSLDAAMARRVSRKHALILRSRETNQYVLRPLARNTGTQVERELATELQDYPLTNGTRIILGGMVRLKFEIIA